MYNECVDMTEQEIMDGLFPPKDYSVEPEQELVKCPRADKCISECYHRTPHVYEAKYCDNERGECGVKCVHELVSDVTFFEDDFEIE